MEMDQSKQLLSASSSSSLASSSLASTSSLPLVCSQSTTCNVGGQTNDVCAIPSGNCPPCLTPGNGFCFHYVDSTSNCPFNGVDCQAYFSSLQSANSSTRWTRRPRGVVGHDESHPSSANSVAGERRASASGSDGRGLKTSASMAASSSSSSGGGNTVLVLVLLGVILGLGSVVIFLAVVRRRMKASSDPTSRATAEPYHPHVERLTDGQSRMAGSRTTNPTHGTPDHVGNAHPLGPQPPIGVVHIILDD